MTDEERKIRLRDNTRRYRARQKAAGIKPPPKTEEQLLRLAKNQANYRERQAALGRPPSPWAIANPERHRENGARWRANNSEKARALTLKSTKRLHATPWGHINKITAAAMRRGVRRQDGSPGPYECLLGYTWLEMRAHLERLFTPEMTWENWGKYWEVDHIEALSRFRYETMSDPEFKRAWALSNIRPLYWRDNRGKGGANVKYK